MMYNISISDFLKNKPQSEIIDIRSIQKYNDNHIPQSKNVPYKKLIINPEKYLNKYKVYYIYCQSGLLSVSVCKKLLQQGYKVVNIDGGYEKWMLEK